MGDALVGMNSRGSQLFRGYVSYCSGLLDATWEGAGQVVSGQKADER